MSKRCSNSSPLSRQGDCSPLARRPAALCSLRAVWERGPWFGSESKGPTLCCRERRTQKRSQEGRRKKEEEGEMDRRRNVKNRKKHNFKYFPFHFFFVFFFAVVDDDKYTSCVWF